MDFAGMEAASAKMYAQSVIMGITLAYKQSIAVLRSSSLCWTVWERKLVKGWVLAVFC